MQGFEGQRERARQADGDNAAVDQPPGRSRALPPQAAPPQQDLLQLQRARQELVAVRDSALPAYLRPGGPASSIEDRSLRMHAAHSVQHMLMVARQRILHLQSRPGLGTAATALHLELETLTRDAQAAGVFDAPGASQGPMPQPLVGVTQPLRADAAPPSTTGAGSLPALPAGAGSREFKVEIGEGSVTGALVITLEWGQTGLIPDSELKVLESTASMQLNGFVAKLEASLLSGEVDVDILDGVSIALEANALTVGTDGNDVDVDLLSISVKLVGDVGHWFAAPRDVTFTLDGRVSIALGGKLLEKLGKYTIARLEERMIAREIAKLGDDVKDQWKKLAQLEKQLAELGDGTRAAREKLQKEILEHKLGISTAGQELKRARGKLAASAQRARQLMGKVQGKVAKSVAKAMEKKAVRFVAEKLAKLVPILNAVSTIKDIIELAFLFKRLLEGEYGGNGEEGAQEAAAADGDDSEGSEGSEGAREGQPKRDEPTENAAARQLVQALTKEGTAGPSLGPDQQKLLDALVPDDLTQAQIAEVLALLRSKGRLAGTADEVVVAIEQAVRAVRNRARVVTVNGRAVANEAGPTHDGLVTSPSQVGGPVTSPRDVDPGLRAPGTHAAKDATPAEIVQHGPGGVIGTWFEERDGVLVLSGHGRAWIHSHTDVELEPGVRLEYVEHQVEGMPDGGWSVKVSFIVQRGRERRTVIHNFHATRDQGRLSFERYLLIELGRQ